MFGVMKGGHGGRAGCDDFDVPRGPAGDGHDDGARASPQASTKGLLEGPRRCHGLPASEVGRRVHAAIVARKVVATLPAGS